MTSGLKEKLGFLAVWHIERRKHSGTKLKLVLNFSSSNKLKKENSVFIKLVYPRSIIANKMRRRKLLNNQLDIN